MKCSSMIKKLEKANFYETKIKEIPEQLKSIVCFCCSWCSYAGADLAGVSRFQYPPTIRIVRVMCSGRVDPAFILESFKDRGAKIAYSLKYFLRRLLGLNFSLFFFAGFLIDRS